MDYQDYVNMALVDNKGIKLILKGEILGENDKKIGVVSVVFITKNSHTAELKLNELNKNKNTDDYYMLYSCPIDIDLTELSHYPSIEIKQANFM